MNRPKAIVIGISGKNLKKVEAALITRVTPFGVIIFNRNISSFFQLKKLVADIRNCSSNDIAIFIDQEGGRVQRLSGGDWPKYPPASVFGDIAKYSLPKALEAVRLNYSLIADDLLNLGINVNCCPCLDLYFENGDQIIGDRSFSADPNIVYSLGKEVCSSMMSRGVFPVIKHIPGHGRADVDSHKDLPIINEDISILKKSDFFPFKKLNNVPFGMTSHILYTSMDTKEPVTFSYKIYKFIREQLNFKGILISDDIEMSALSGSLKYRAEKVINSGYDLVLYCKGNHEHNELLLNILPKVSEDTWYKWKNYNKNNKISINFDKKESINRLKYLVKNIYI